MTTFPVFLVLDGTAQETEGCNGTWGTLLRETDHQCMPVPSQQQSHPSWSQTWKPLHQWWDGDQNWRLWFSYKTRLRWWTQEVLGFCSQWIWFLSKHFHAETSYSFSSVHQTFQATIKHATSLILYPLSLKYMIVISQLVLLDLSVAYDSDIFSLFQAWSYCICWGVN